MPTPARVDWPQIKELWPADERCVAILERRAIHVILSLFERFEWLATYDKSQEAADDWDYIQRIMADAEYELGVAMPLSELIPYIDEIETLLRALNNHAECCEQPVDWSEGDDFTDSVTDGVGDVPQNIIDAGYATGVTDWDGFDDYKCMIAHVMVDSMELTLRQVIDLYGSSGEIIGGIGSVAAIFGTIATLTGPLVVGIIGVVGAVAGAAATLLGIGEVATEALADGIAANHDELACAIYGSDGSDAAVEALKDKIDELFSVVNAALLKNMALGPSIKALYAGRYDQTNIAQNLADNGYDTADYDCTCAGPTPEGIPYAYAFTITRMNSEHSNPTLAAVRIRGSATSAYPNITDEIGTVSSLGGNGQGTVIDVQVIVGASAHGRAYDVFVQRTFNSPPGRTNERFALSLWNGNSIDDKLEELWISEFEGWISNDGGSTGEWWPMVLTKESGDAGWSIVGNMPRFNWGYVPDSPDDTSAYFHHEKA